MAFVTYVNFFHHKSFFRCSARRTRGLGSSSRVFVCVRPPEGSGTSKISLQSQGNNNVDSTPTEITYCQKCGSEMEQRTPEGDVRTRKVCTNCQVIAYENPKLVVGCVPISRDKQRVLLARRAIPPVGKWTIPAGFLEMGENTEVGAAREAWEETNAQLDMQPLTLLAVYNILPAQQVQLLYRCTLLNEESVEPGEESQEVRMFKWDDIPWEELAFPTVQWALEYSRKKLNETTFLPDLKSR